MPKAKQEVMVSISLEKKKKKTILPLFLNMHVAC